MPSVGMPLVVHMEAREITWREYLAPHVGGDWLQPQQSNSKLEPIFTNFFHFYRFISLNHICRVRIHCKEIYATLFYKLRLAFVILLKIYATLFSKLRLAFVMIPITGFACMKPCEHLGMSLDLEKMGLRARSLVKTHA